MRVSRRSLAAIAAFSVIAVSIGAFVLLSHERHPATGVSTRTDGVGGPIAFVAAETQPPASTLESPAPPPPTDIYTVAADGSGLRRLTTDGAPKGSLAWSPDGTTLAYTVYPLGASREQLWAIDASGTHRRLLCTGCTATFKLPYPNSVGDSYIGPAPYSDRLAWSPSGGVLAAPAYQQGGITLIDPTSKRIRKVASARVAGISWSPDGTSLAVAESRKGLAILDVATSRLRLVNGMTTLYGPVAWSPDGGEIAVANTYVGPSAIRQGLVGVNPDTGRTTTLLPDDSTFGVYALGWSPDSSEVVVLHHPIHPPTEALLAVSRDGSEIRMIALCENGSDKDGLCPAIGVARSPDGDRLLFANYAASSPPALVVLPPTGVPIRISGLLVPGCCFAWSRVG